MAFQQLNHCCRTMASESVYSSFYPESFRSSRDRFLAEAHRLKAVVRTLPLDVPLLQPDTELSIDVALIGDPHSQPTLMHIAGTHGIEGFVGSAIQYAILSQLAEPPKHYALAFVHCLNPWGMAYLRRTNAYNVDLNRNCTSTDDDRRGAPPGYEYVRSLLLPERSLSLPFFCVSALTTVLRYGFPTAKQAITGGQYVDQQGLFFGGLSLQQELSLMRSWALEHLVACKRILIVDVHSGLGTFCQDALLVDSHEHCENSSRISKLFPGHTIHGPDPERSLSYETRGSIGALLPSVLPNATIDYVVHEFGTLHSFRVLHALVTENYHYFKSKQGEDSTRSRFSSALLKEAFCPSSPLWRRHAIRRGLDIFRVATNSLSRG
jgi:hypothetical protein